MRLVQWTFHDNERSVKEGRFVISVSSQVDNESRALILNDRIQTPIVGNCAHRGSGAMGEIQVIGTEVPMGRVGGTRYSRAVPGSQHGRWRPLDGSRTTTGE